MSQLSRVETVEITSGDHAVGYHGRQVRAADEVLLTDSMALDSTLP